MKDPKETRQARLDLYNEISKTANYGDFDTFNQALDDPQARKDLFNEISKKANYGNFGEFDDALAPTVAQQRYTAPSDEQKSWWDKAIENLSNMRGGRIGMTEGDRIRAELTTQGIEKTPANINRAKQQAIETAPYVTAIGEGIMSGSMILDQMTGKLSRHITPNKKSVSDTYSEKDQAEDAMWKEALSDEDYKKHKGITGSLPYRITRDVTAGITSSAILMSVGALTGSTSLGRGFEAIKESGNWRSLGGIASKLLGAGGESLLQLGPGALVQSIDESIMDKTNFVANIAEYGINAALEGISETLLPELGGGKHFLTKAVRKSLGSFITESLTENVSDMSQDFFNYIRDRNLPAQSIIGSMIENKSLIPSKEAFYNLMIEGLSGAVMGAGYGGFEKHSEKDGKKVDDALKQYVKDNPEKVKEFYDKVMQSVQMKSTSPELIKSFGMASEYSKLIAHAGDNYDESLFDTEDKKAIHTQAKEVANEAAQSELMPAINTIISKDGNANLLDAILITGKAKKDGYQLGVENQLGTSLGGRPSMLNIGNVHEFTSKVLAELKTDKNISDIHEKFSKEFSPVMADDMLLGVLYPQLMPITSGKISSSAIDAQEHAKVMRTIQSQAEALKNDPKLFKGLQNALNASVLKASEAMAKSVKTPIAPRTEDAPTEIKKSERKSDDFIDIFGPDRSQEELDNKRAEEMMNSTEFTKEIPPGIPLNVLMRNKLQPSEAPLLAEAAEAEEKAREEEGKTEGIIEQTEGKTEAIPETSIPVSLSSVMRKSDAEILQEGIKNGTVKEVMPAQVPEETANLSELTLKELKARAKGKVKGFSKMDKATLIESLKQAEENKKESSKVFKDESTGDSYVVQGKGIFDDIDNESDPDLLPNFDEVVNTGKEIPELQDLPSNVDLNYFMQAFNKKHQIGDNSLNRLLLSISKAIGGRLTVKIVTDDKEIARLFTLKDKEGVVSGIPSAGAYLNGTIYINGKINSHTVYDAKSLRRTILHEALHGLTVDMLNPNHDSFNPAFKKQINALLDVARKNINLSGITNANDRMRVEYALKNDKEFIAGIYSGSSASLVGLLDKIDIPASTGKSNKTESLWTKVSTTIKEALKNVYESAIKKQDAFSNFLETPSVLDEMNKTMDTFFDMIHTEAVIADKAPKDIEEKPPDVSSQYTLSSIFRTKQSVTPTPLRTTETAIAKVDQTAQAKPEAIATQKEEAHSGEDDNDTDLPSNVEVKSSFQDNPELITLNNIQSLAQSLTRFFGGSIDGKNYNAFLNKFDFSQYMQFYDSIASKTDERTKEARELLEKEYDSKYKHSNMTFEEFADRRLRSLWNYNKAQNEQYVLDIVYGQGIDGAIFKLVKRLGSYKSADGKTGNTLQAPKLIEQYKDQLEQVLGAKFDFFYVNGFSRDGSGDLKGFHSTFDVSTADCANALYDQTDYDGSKARYIFLNVFGEKSTLPLLKLKAGEHLNLELLDRIRNLHASALGEKYVMESTEAEKVTNTARIILEELRLGNTVENIQNYSKETAYTLGKDFARLMKRSYLVMDTQYLEQDKHLIDKLQLDDKLSRPEGIQVIADDKNPGKKKIVVNSIIMDTEDIPEVNIDLGIKAPDEKGIMQPVMVSLRDLLLNAICKQTTDGASVYVMGKFDEVYRSAFGLAKGGDIKNFINYNSMYIKHAMHGISSKDALGKWMLANDIAMITFDSAEKNGKKIGDKDRYPLVKASEIGTQLDPQKVMQIPLENFYHIKEGGVDCGEN